MKKIFISFLSLMVIFVLAACSDKADPVNSNVKSKKRRQSYFTGSLRKDNRSFKKSEKCSFRSGTKTNDECTLDNLII